MQNYQSLIGIAIILLITIGVSENRSRIDYKSLGKGLLFQFVLAIVLLKVPFIQSFLGSLNQSVLELQKATQAGTSLVFGYLGGGPLPFDEKSPGMSFVLGLQALPMILIFSALSALLYYWRVLPLVIGCFAWLLGRVLNVTGATSFASIATVFVGIVEAPLLIRPYLNGLSKAELFVVMSTGMSTISGTVLVIYASFLQSSVPNVVTHLIIASLISAPGAIVLSLVAMPKIPLFESQPSTLEDHDMQGHGLRSYIKALLHTTDAHKKYQSTMDAISDGTYQGMKLLASVIAMLIVLVALVSLGNSILQLLPYFDGSALTIQRIIGWVMQPFSWTLGIEWKDTQIAGQLMGTKLVLNEFITYLDLSKLDPNAISEHSRVLLTYLLCGFANFGSLGIVIAGIGSMAPDRQKEIVQMGAKSLLIGTLSTCLSAAMIGLLLF
jgi:CNT family concentrative nucleoside transporter